LKIRFLWKFKPCIPLEIYCSFRWTSFFHLHIIRELSVTLAFRHIGTLPPYYRSCQQ